jgi:leucyl/phenylalanyl-tRNA---protein transferase
MKIPFLNVHQPTEPFPPVHHALNDPNGLLAIGGCLSPTRLLNAYRHGIFPWFNPDDPILWWSPNPRLVLFPTQLYVSRRLAKTIRSGKFIFTIDTAFEHVIDACSKPRNYTDNTWITNEIKHAYTQLHQQGIAHSAEVWYEGQLVGGLYGIALGQVFFGESMFHTQTDASKVAFVQLVQALTRWNYQIIDCQVHTDHLSSLGAYEINRLDFIDVLNRYCETPPHSHAWKL